MIRFLSWRATWETQTREFHPLLQQACCQRRACVSILLFGWPSESISESSATSISLPFFQIAIPSVQRGLSYRWTNRSRARPLTVGTGDTCDQCLSMPKALIAENGHMNSQTLVGHWFNWVVGKRTISVLTSHSVCFETSGSLRTPFYSRDHQPPAPHKFPPYIGINCRNFLRAGTPDSLYAPYL